MSHKLLIGNLSLETSEMSLRELFSRAGQVQSVNLVIDPQSGKKKGFAFVEMGTDAEAEKAKRCLDGADIDGRPIIINLSQSIPERLSLIAKCIRLLHG